MPQPLLSAIQYHTFPRPLPLWRGGALASVTLANETWGALSPNRDNVVLLLHALTGDSHAADPHEPDNPKAAWWNPLIGPGRAFDTDRYFVICSNVIGGCQGTTGPASTDPETGKPYALNFPVITVQDMVRAQREMLTGLGIRRLAAVAGGSIGGMQALEWAVRYPADVDAALLFGATERIGPQAIGFNAIGRSAIMLDPAWCDGRYEPGHGPDTGLQIARMVGMLTYQSSQGQWLRFGREPASRPASASPLGEKFDIEGYLEYQGRSLARRFDANSYLYLTRAMDLYDVADGWESEGAALERIRARTLHVGMSTDWLYPPEQVRALAQKLDALGKDAVYTELTSVHGHDAFLKEWPDMERIVGEYLDTPRVTLHAKETRRPAPTPAQAT
ncbi:MAG: homoserine O-acetyltransferase [Chloroflexia bacterium]|nr:homoserine O-acetyltransferase [Chloroflexia bacterium]